MKLELELPDAAIVVQAPRPLFVSQHTSEALLGLRRRAFLEVVAAFRAAGGEVLCVGRARLCELEPLIEWLRIRCVAAADPDTTENEAEQLLAASGLRVVAGGARR
jgi:hypothetical protein